MHRFHWFEVITRQPTDLRGKTLVGRRAIGGHSSHPCIILLKFSVGLDDIFHGRLP